MNRCIVFSTLILFLEATAMDPVKLHPIGLRSHKTATENSTECQQRWPDMSLAIVLDLKRAGQVKELKRCFEEQGMYLKDVERNSFTNEINFILNLTEDAFCFMTFAAGLIGSEHAYRFDMKRRNVIVSSKQFSNSNDCDLTICEQHSSDNKEICILRWCRNPGESLPCTSHQFANISTVVEQTIAMNLRTEKNPIFDDFCDVQCRYGSYNMDDLSGTFRLSFDFKRTQKATECQEELNGTVAASVPLHETAEIQLNGLGSVLHLWILLSICIGFFVVLFVWTILAIIGFKRIIAKMVAGMNNIIHIPTVPPNSKSKITCDCGRAKLRSPSCSTTTVSPVKITKTNWKPVNNVQVTRNPPLSSPGTPMSSTAAMPGSDSLPLASVCKKARTETSKPSDDTNTNPLQDHEPSSLTGDENGLSKSKSSRKQLNLETPPGSEGVFVDQPTVSPEVLMFPFRPAENGMTSKGGPQLTTAENRNKGSEDRKANSSGGSGSSNSQPWMVSTDCFPLTPIETHEPHPSLAKNRKKRTDVPLAVEKNVGEEEPEESENE